MALNISDATIFDAKLCSLAETTVNSVCNNFTSICLGKAAARRGACSSSPSPVQPFGIFAEPSCKVACQYSSAVWMLILSDKHWTTSYKVLKQCLASSWYKAIVLRPSFELRIKGSPLAFQAMRWSSTEQAHRSTWLHLYKFSGLSSSTYKLAYLKQALLKGFKLSWSADGCCWSSCSSLDLICWCLRARVAAHIRAVSEIRQSYS